MTLKLLIFFTTCVCFLVHATDVERRAADDAETYITKEAAKELRNKLNFARHHADGSSVERQPDDYDEILKEIIRHLPKQQQQQPEVFFEKKYFDYLPNDISESEDMTSDELSLYVSSEEQQQQLPKHERTKRDVTEQQAARGKRQSVFYTIPLTHYNPYPNLHFYYPIHDPIFHSFPHVAAESRNDFGPVIPNPNYNNPWTPQKNPQMKFHQPGNFYLPPTNTYLPAVNNNQPGVNVPHPPDNPPRPTGENDEGEEIGDRIELFAGQDKGPVWDYKTMSPNQGTNQPRPVPPVIGPNQQYSPPPRPNSIPVVKPNEKFPTDDVGIEYAPELQEDLETTTRASFKIPDRKNRNKQQNNNRQKKSVWLSDLDDTRA